MKIAVTGLRGIPATWGGIEVQCEQVYTRLASMGFDVTVFARSHYVKNDIRHYKGVRIKRLPTLRIKGLEAFVHTFLAVLYILKQNPEIIHLYAQGPCLFSWLPRLFRPRMRIFFTCQGLDWQRKKWSCLQSMVIFLGELASVLFPHCRIVVSKELQHYYQRRYGVKTVYVPNGVSKPAKRAPNIIRSFDLAPRGYFLCVGRFVPEKRWEDVLRAYAQKTRRAKLVFTGDSSSTDAYVDMLKQIAGSNPDIIFTGYRYGDALAELFSNARAFITASELEGLPLTLLEALSYGLPCIVSNIAPHKEIMRDICAHVFPTGDLETLSQQMDDVDRLSHQELDAIGQTVGDMVAVNFNWNDITRKIGHLYENSSVHSEIASYDPKI